MKIANKKKLALVTWIGMGNYGTMLQSYALYQKLRLWGYSVYFVEIAPNLKSVKSYIKIIIDKFGYYRFKRKRFASESLKNKKIIAFQNRTLKIQKVFTEGQRKHMLSDTDVFITGSDQIWNTAYAYNPTMFLDFAGDKKRIAYGSSIGTTDVPNKYKEKVREHLRLFSHIGIREETAVEILRNVVGREDIVQVLDPTFLLREADWIQFAQQAEIEFDIPQRFILCYLIGNNPWYVQDVEKIKAQTGIEEVIIIPAVENPDFKIRDAFVYQDAGPREFIDLIRRATVVCTDSFHATAISINLSKGFVEFLRFRDSDPNSQNSRIYDILRHYHLERRLYSAETTSWMKEIDYTSVQSILENDRSFSFNYLKTAIEK